LEAFTFGTGVKTDWYGTLRGRLGYTNGPSLFHATGGAAFVDLRNNSDILVPAAVLASRSETASGWVVGGGIETALGNNWSAKAEYIYIDAGSQDVFNLGLADIAHFDNRFHVYKYGMNYRFGGTAVSRTVLPSVDWTGLYVGMNAGAGLSSDRVMASISIGAAEIATARFTGGVQAGYNWQPSPNIVTGIEGDLGWLGVNRSVVDFAAAFGVKTDWYGTLRGRIGYNTGQALLYGTGGLAFVNVKNSFERTINPALVSKSETAAAGQLAPASKPPSIRNGPQRRNISISAPEVRTYSTLVSQEIPTPTSKTTSTSSVTA
jgi:outer membrane immunogenic protein